MLPRDTRTKLLFESKYFDKPIKKYAIVTACGNVVWWAYIFRGDRGVWYAFRNGERATVSKVNAEIISISTEKSTLSDPGVDKRALFEAI